MATAAAITAPATLAPERDSAPETITLIVANMNCGGCLGKVERALSAQPGVTSARANLSAKRVTVNFDARATEPETLIATLEKAGFSATTLAPQAADPGEKLNRDLLSRLGVAGFASANIMLLSVSVWSGEVSGMDEATKGLFHWLSALIALPVVAYSGQPFFRSAWAGLKARRLNMDLPISLAILLSAGMSLFQATRGSDQVYFDACVALLFFLLIGRFLDQRMRTKAASAAQNLLGLRAEWATVIGNDGSAERLPVRLVTPGMRVIVAAGERLPADGVVVSGATEIDESLLTGETTPRNVSQGAQVYAGTVNLGGVVQIRVTAVETGTLLAEIARLMEAAEQSRGLYRRLADRAARLYSPFVHLLAATTFSGWMILGFGWEPALTAAIAVLIITCPCALALAVPAVQVAASSRLFAGGVLVKAPDALERLSDIDTIVFDKTGTLTTGKADVLNAGDLPAPVLADAAALGASSRHPYAQAVVRAARAGGLDVQPVENAVEHPGAGVAVLRADGETRLGSAAFCGVTDSASAGAASLWYVRPGIAPIAFVLGDTLKDDAVGTISALMRAGYAVEILSGDRAEEVEKVASQLGVQAWRAGCKPQDKITRLDELRASGRKVLMVGDGLNDAPALAAGRASASPASAADISQAASDVVFMGERLAPLIELLKTSRQSQRMAFENFAVAGAYNLVFVPLAMAGHVNPLIAALAMSTSSILVTANALRLRTMRLELSR
jgi:Cu2+-exporting ATPase